MLVFEREHETNGWIRRGWEEKKAEQEAMLCGAGGCASALSICSLYPFGADVP